MPPGSGVGGTRDSAKNAWLLNPSNPPPVATIQEPIRAEPSQVTEAGDSYGTLGSAYVLWSLGVNATRVGESCGLLSRRLLWRGSPKRSGLRFGIGGRRVMRTG